MPQDVKLYKLLISCPGDVKDEIYIIKDAVEQFNELYSDALGITIQTKYWHKSSYAQSGGKPQELLNQQFVNDCDAAVAIFWTRFGTPTDNYGSGTEEEIETMLKSGKQVFLYFSDKPIPPSMINSEGYDKIQELKDKYTGRGLYWTYSTNEGFKELFFAHLSQYFLSEKRVSEIKSKHSSALKLCCIDDKNCLKEEIIIQPFCFNVKYNIEKYIATIEDLFYKIEQTKINPQNVVINTGTIAVNRPISIKHNDKEIIIGVASKLNIVISETFFDLGGLSTNTIMEAIYGTELEGTEDEKNKYYLIIQLLDMINSLYNWFPIEEAFNNLNCICLALKNEGTAIDEDVEVSFKVSKMSFMAVEDFPKLEYQDMKYITNECDIEELFSISSTANYTSFWQSQRRSTPKAEPLGASFNRYIHHDCEEEYYDALNETFCYAMFEDTDNYIVKLSFDYIKHNTVIAFPTVLFVNETPKQIPYKITSKNNPSIVEGILTDI